MRYGLFLDAKKNPLRLARRKVKPHMDPTIDIVGGGSGYLVPPDPHTQRNPRKHQARLAAARHHADMKSAGGMLSPQYRKEDLITFIRRNIGIDNIRRLKIGYEGKIISSARDLDRMTKKELQLLIQSVPFSLTSASRRTKSTSSNPSRGKKRVSSKKKAAGKKLAKACGGFRKGSAVSAPKGSRRGQVRKKNGQYYRVMKNPHGRNLIMKPIYKPKKTCR